MSSQRHQAGGAFTEVLSAPPSCSIPPDRADRGRPAGANSRNCKHRRRRHKMRVILGGTRVITNHNRWPIIQPGGGGAGQDTQQKVNGHICSKRSSTNHSQNPTHDTSFKEEEAPTEVAASNYGDIFHPKTGMAAGLSQFWTLSPLLRGHHAHEDGPDVVGVQESLNGVCWQ